MFPFSHIRPHQIIKLPADCFTLDPYPRERRRAGGGATERERERQRETERDRERQRQRQTNRQPDRQTDRQTVRQTENKIN